MRQKVRRTLLLSFLFLFPVTFNYYSPYLPIEGTTQKVATFSLLFWGGWLVASLFLGRSACGYICPLGALQEVWDWAVARRLMRWKNGSVLKYAISAIWVGGIIYAAIAFGGWERVGLLYNTPTGISWDSPDRAGIYLGMFGLVLLVCLPLGRRAFCHYLCWWAPLNTAGTKVSKALRLPGLHLKPTTDNCIKCGTCTRNCQMSLPVQEMVARGNMSNTECILCGVCADNCGDDAINYAFSVKQPG